MTVIAPSLFYVFGVFASAALVTFVLGWLLLRLFWPDKKKKGGDSL